MHRRARQIALKMAARRTMFEKTQFLSDQNFRTKSYNFSMKKYCEANKVWIFAPKIIVLLDHFWCENSNFIRFKLNFHAWIVDFGAKIKIREKLRFSEQCAAEFDAAQISRKHSIHLCGDRFPTLREIKALFLHPFWITSVLGTQTNKICLLFRCICQQVLTSPLVNKKSTNT